MAAAPLHSTQGFLLESSESLISYLISLEQSLPFKFIYEPIDDKHLFVILSKKTLTENEMARRLYDKKVKNYWALKKIRSNYEAPTHSHNNTEREEMEESNSNAQLTNNELPPQIDFEIQKSVLIQLLNSYLDGKLYDRYFTYYVNFNSNFVFLFSFSYSLIVFFSHLFTEWHDLNSTSMNKAEEVSVNEIQLNANPNLEAANVKNQLKNTSSKKRKLN
jgi:hypothetical protein